MSKYFRALFFVLAGGTPLIALADFCAVNQAGMTIGCYPTLDTCRNIAAGVRGGCVLGGGQSQGYQRQPTLGEVLYQGGQDAQRNAGPQNDQTQRDRAAMHPKLLPLVPQDHAIGRETQGIIFSTLQRSLEMDTGYSRREFSNNNTGASGHVAVNPSVTNQYGDICRDFSITFMTSDIGARSVNGTACRRNGKWGWL